MMEFLYNPWPWYVSGPAISLILFLLLFAGERFGVSSSLDAICSLGGAGKKWDYFKISKDKYWTVAFVVGSILGGFIGKQFLSNGTIGAISQNTISKLNKMNIDVGTQYIPVSHFSWENLLTIPTFICLVIGGFLVGFGTRWAGGCTSGHAISGISNFQGVSLIAVVGFFVGGLFSTHFLLPLIF